MLPGASQWRRCPHKRSAGVAAVGRICRCAGGPALPGARGGPGVTPISLRWYGRRHRQGGHRFDRCWPRSRRSRPDHLSRRHRQDDPRRLKVHGSLTRTYYECALLASVFPPALIKSTPGPPVAELPPGAEIVSTSRPRHQSSGCRGRTASPEWSFVVAPHDGDRPCVALASVISCYECGLAALGWRGAIYQLGVPSSARAGRGRADPGVDNAASDGMDRAGTGVGSADTGALRHLRPPSFRTVGQTRLYAIEIFDCRFVSWESSAHPLVLPSLLFSRRRYPVSPFSSHITAPRS